MSTSRKDELLTYLKNDNSKIIDCSNHELRGNDLPDLIKILKEKPEVTNLNLSYLSIGIADIESLKELILTTKGLKVLKLKYNKLGDEGILSLINDPKLSNLIKHIDFDFGNNNIHDNGLEILYTAASKGLITPNSLLPALLGNPIYNSELKDTCINLYYSTQQQKNSLSSNPTLDKQKDAKENNDYQDNINTNNSEPSLSSNNFFSKTATPRTSDTSSKPPSTSSSGTTSKTSTPPSEEVIEKRTRKLSKSNDPAD